MIGRGPNHVLSVQSIPERGGVEEVLGRLGAVDVVEDADAVVAGRLGGDVAGRVGGEHDVEGHVSPHGPVARPQPRYHL